MNIDIENIIEKLYVKEGKSKQYIANLLNIDKIEINKIVNKYRWVQGNNNYLKPSIKKYINSNRKNIENALMKHGTSLYKISKELKIPINLLKEILLKDKNLKVLFEKISHKNNSVINKEAKKDIIENNMDIKPILGYDNYFISRNKQIYFYENKKYIEIQSNLNVKNNKFYVKIKDKTLNLDNIYKHTFNDDIKNSNSAFNEKQMQVCKKGKVYEYYKDGKLYTFKTERAYIKFIKSNKTI